MNKVIKYPFKPGDIVIPGDNCGYYLDEHCSKVLIFVSKCFEGGSTPDSISFKFHGILICPPEINIDCPNKGWRCDEFLKIGSISEEYLRIVYGIGKFR